MTPDPLATDDTITVPIPTALAADFVENESFRLPSKREVFALTLGEHDLGQWRIDSVASQYNDGAPRMAAVLRRVLPWTAHPSPAASIAPASTPDARRTL